jgi:hypothetical protein
VRYGLLYLARLQQKPRSAKQTLRVLRHEAFPVAMDLLKVMAVADAGAAQSLARWQDVRARVEAGKPLVEQRHERRRYPRRRKGVRG